MHVLYETSLGFALFRKNPLKLDALSRFSSAQEAADALERCTTGYVPQSVVDMLEKNNIQRLEVANGKIAEAIAESMAARGHLFKVLTGTEEVESTAKSIHSRLSELLNVTPRELERASLLLAHALSRERLKLTPTKLDWVLVQGVAVLDKLDKDINTKCMKLREWYGMHFPEIGEVIQDNKRYLETILEHMNNEANGEELDEAVVKAFQTSLGGAIEKDDEEIIKASAASVLQMFETRERLQQHLRLRMEQIAPNLLELLGEYMGARLIAHAGSLADLARKPSSTIQVMGAEKALFKSIKETKGEKKNTPKYGYIFNTSYVGQMAPPHKGAIARTLAGKIALAGRCDMYADDEDAAEEGGRSAFARRAKAEIEKRMQVLAGQGKGKSSTKSKSIVPLRQMDKFAFKPPKHKTKRYSADSDAASSKRPRGENS